MKSKKTYSFAFWSSIYLTFFNIIFVTVCYFYKFNFFAIITATIALFSTTFFIIQYRTEYFIYQKVKKIYDGVSLLDNTDLEKKSVITNMDTFTKKVKDFVEDKRIEIQNLTKLDSFRRDFLGNVAHELKTPLFTVQGYILTLLEGAAENKEIRTKYLDRANKGTERLVSIIKDLDMIAKLETEGLKMNIEVFNILELIQNVFDLFEMKSKKRKITLKFDKIYEFPIFLRADLERIEQVLINLIENSIKYGKIGGITTISINDYNKSKYIIKVSDNGEGIKQEHISRLFERFYRIDQSRSRDQGGSGLGLSIVKHIIEAHNENIFLKSNFGEGSEFSFTLQKAI